MGAEPSLGQARIQRLTAELALVHQHKWSLRRARAELDRQDRVANIRATLLREVKAYLATPPSVGAQG